MLAHVVTMLAMLAENQPMSPFCWHQDWIHGWVMSWVLCRRKTAKPYLQLIASLLWWRKQSVSKKNGYLYLHINVHDTLIIISCIILCRCGVIFCKYFLFFCPKESVAMLADIVLIWHAVLFGMVQLTEFDNILAQHYPKNLQQVGMLAAETPFEGGGSVDTTQGQHFWVQFCCLNITSTFDKSGWIKYMGLPLLWFLSWHKKD